MSGARNTLLLSTLPVSSTPLYTGSGPSQIITYNSFNSPRTGTFSAAPAIGDLLIAFCGTGNGSITPPSAVGSWTQFEAINGGGGGLGTYAGGRAWFYLYVTIGSVTTYTPATQVNASENEGTAIWDIPASAVTGVWANDFGGFTDVSQYVLTTMAWSINTSGNNSQRLVLAAANVNSVSGVTTGSLTGDVTNGITTNNGTVQNIMNAAWVGAPFASGFNSSFTQTGASGRVAAVGGSVIIN